MTLPAAWALQVGLRSHLGASSALAAHLGSPSRIYDRVPEDAVFPLLTIGESRIRPLDGHDQAMEHDIRLNAWSRWGGRKELREIADAVHDALHDADFTVDGIDVISTRFVFADMFRQPESDTYQAVMRYRIVTDRTAE